ncbi:MAG: hypothetical protein KAI57_03715 [Candidatus Pacebacteria bacterium]|nr:hypothetical protein [Candidatus Paceibacterota bacterium]
MQYYLMTDYYWMMLDRMVYFYDSLISQGLISALIIMIIGLIFGHEFGKLTTSLVRNTGINKVLEKMGMKKFLKKGGMKFSVENLAGWIVKWFFIFFALMTAVDLLNLKQTSDFLNEMLFFVPNLIVALVILTIGLIISQMIFEALEATARATGIKIYHLAAIGVKYLLIVVTLLVVFEQVGIKTEILRIFAGGISLMIALAGGLAFGLGGQYYARELLEDFKNNMKK